MEANFKERLGVLESRIQELEDLRTINDEMVETYKEMEITMQRDIDHNAKQVEDMKGAFKEIYEELNQSQKTCAQYKDKFIFLERKIKSLQHIEKKSASGT